MIEVHLLSTSRFSSLYITLFFASSYGCTSKGLSLSSGLSGSYDTVWISLVVDVGEVGSESGG